MEREKKEILHYENVSFVREGRTILKNINWHTESDENWVLLGLNGSGKSTILGMIPAYTFPTKGEVRVFGHRFGNYVWKNVKDRVGFVSSSLNNFLFTLNKEKLKDIVISGKFSSIGIYQKINKKDEERAEKIIEDFKISYIKDKYFSTLSQGEQRRTLLARAFMNEPELLILDEPCSGLDIVSREYFLSVLEERTNSRKKIPFIYVTHRIEEIIPSVTHVALLKDGEIMAQGLKKDILTDKFLTELFGISVRIEWENERPWLVVK
ncbi:MAG: ATP-binding cassette domain-containing protein [Leptotrichiaceae bacterium]|nr:ATP-binding cassette domain-containing protein [Leptotrichiaceae bacterium]